MSNWKFVSTSEKRGGYSSSSTPANKLTPPPSGVAPGAKQPQQSSRPK